MISFVPLFKTLNKLKVSKKEFCRALKIPQEPDFFTRTDLTTDDIFYICRRLNCEIKDIIEYIDEDGNVPEVKGYTFCEEDLWDLPHLWTPLNKKINLTSFTEGDIRKYFGMCERLWYLLVKRIREGKWTYFSKSAVRSLLDLTGCELWELCEDVKPKKRTVPLEDSLIEYLYKKGVRHEKCKKSMQD